LVEDNEGEANLLQIGLRKAGGTSFHVNLATCLSDAIAELIEGVNEVVLLDLSLPDSDGLWTLEAILLVAPQIPIIVLTGNDDEALGISAVQAGAADYLMKGRIEAASLIRAIRYSIERHQILARIREFDQLRSQFLATASHEMRTPLTVIREFTSLLHDGICGPVTSDQQDSLRLVMRNCDRLTDLLNNLLDLKRIRSGQRAQRRDRCDLRPLIEQCRRDLNPKCSARRQTIRLELPETLPLVLADTNQVEEVLVNLAGNASKFTPEGGSIVLRAVATGDRVRIEVEDTGRGIPPESISAIFEPFGQVQRADVSIERGTGLGLTISQEIIGRHGGEIGVTSPPSGGSCFFFTIPIWSASVAFHGYLSDRFLAPGRASDYMMLFRPSTERLDLANLGLLLQKEVRARDHLFEIDELGLVGLLELADAGECSALATRIAEAGHVECDWAMVPLTTETDPARLFEDISAGAFQFNKLASL
jgi:signal transduction histidine kinase